ncbi:hypothetical protein HZU72_17740 [Halomonas sp. QX-2]|uniref:Uncharacterized protein n=1 Tax=Vreelandella sedimenti TaxID=2729618 RepID=A0A7Z0SPS2_9GAMM|nr:hypothetical protein [Halomonas sedimenti]NYT74256.1 hypothetical protein [Halomonas sedimenti]
MSFEQAVVNLEQTNAALQEEVVRFRDAAMGFNAVYPTITEGRQAVDDGKYFSVPGGGAYMRLYRRQGTSSELIAEFPDRAQVQSLVDVLGGRGVVGGSGDLVARGYGSLGTNARPMPDGDTLATLSQFGLFHVAANDPDLPLVTGLGVVLHLPANTAANATQLLFRAGGSRQALIRDGGPGNYNHFVPIFHAGNILSPISFDDEVPSGGLMESDSNSDGSWEILATGRIKMRMKKGITTGITNHFDLPKPLATITGATISVTTDTDLTAWSSNADRGSFRANGRFNNAGSINVLADSNFFNSPTSGEVGSVFIEVEGDYI